MWALLNHYDDISFKYAPVSLPGAVTSSTYLISSEEGKKVQD